MMAVRGDEKGCDGKTSGMLSYPKIGTSVTGNKNTRKTHIWFCYRCYRKEKTKTPIHSTRGDTRALSPPGDTRVLSPPGMLPLLPQEMLFSPVGINMCWCAIMLFQWVSKRYVGVSLPGTFRLFLLPQKKSVTHSPLQSPACYRYR